MVFKQLHGLDVAEQEFIPFGGMGEDRVRRQWQGGNGTPLGAWASTGWVLGACGIADGHL